MCSVRLTRFKSSGRRLFTIITSILACVDFWGRSATISMGYDAVSKLDCLIKQQL